MKGTILVVGIFFLGISATSAYFSPTLAERKCREVSDRTQRNECFIELTKMIRGETNMKNSETAERQKCLTIEDREERNECFVEQAEKIEEEKEEKRERILNQNAPKTERECLLIHDNDERRKCLRRWKQSGQIWLQERLQDWWKYPRR